MTASEKLDHDYQELSARLELFKIVSKTGSVFCTKKQAAQRLEESMKKLYALTESFDLSMNFDGDYQLTFPVKRDKNNFYSSAGEQL